MQNKSINFLKQNFEQCKYIRVMKMLSFMWNIIILYILYTHISAAKTVIRYIYGFVIGEMYLLASKYP